MYNNNDNDKDNLSFLIRSSSPFSSSPLASRRDPLGKKKESGGVGGEGGGGGGCGTTMKKETMERKTMDI